MSVFLCALLLLTGIVAVWAAIAALIGELWLHETAEFGSGAKHSVGTSRYAELTCRTVLGKVAGGQGSGGE